MDEQLSLDLFEPRLPRLWDDDPNGLKLYENFKRFHEANPHVYEMLRDLAFEKLNSGLESCTIARIFEIARERLSGSAQDDSASKTKFSLNNTYRAGYSRMLMHNEKRLKGFFKVRSNTVEAQYKRGRKPWKD